MQISLYGLIKSHALSNVPVGVYDFNWFLNIVGWFILFNLVYHEHTTSYNWKGQGQMK